MSDVFSAPARRAARLAAVQGLYQMETAADTPAQVMTDAMDGRLPRLEDEAFDGEIDLDLMRRLLTVAVENQEALDTTIARSLSENWRLERLDAVARAILRAGAAELWARRDVPTAVVIDEYVEIAKAYFDAPQPGFINAALDVCAKVIREPA
jgi:transcription antitermination protein NusB